MKIGVIDYGMGNLFSVEQALKRLGCEVIVTAQEQELDKADALLLPGVGAFPDAMKRLAETKLDSYLQKVQAEHRPLLGICLGMQCMVIEFARNVLGYADANSTEMEVSTKHNVIDLMESQKSVSNMGGTMRLGEYDCVLDPDSKTAKAYQSTHIKERHRHRFEFNSDYRAEFEAAGMKCVGENPETHLVEVVEIPSLSWFIGVQYHPEYNSTVLRPNPLFIDFIKAVIKNKK